MCQRPPQIGRLCVTGVSTVRLVAIVDGAAIVRSPLLSLPRPRQWCGARPAELGSTTGLVYSQKLLLSAYGCAKMCGALQRSAISSLLLLLRGAAPHRRSSGCSQGCSSAGGTCSATNGTLAASASPRRSTRAEAALRSPLRAVQQPQLSGGMAGLAAPLTVCLCPTRAKPVRPLTPRMIQYMCRVQSLGLDLD
jgi:hypothetical protein